MAPESNIHCSNGNLPNFEKRLSGYLSPLGIPGNEWITFYEPDTTAGGEEPECFSLYEISKGTYYLFPSREFTIGGRILGEKKGEGYMVVINHDQSGTCVYKDQRSGFPGFSGELWLVRDKETKLIEGFPGEPILETNSELVVIPILHSAKPQIMIMTKEELEQNQQIVQEVIRGERKLSEYQKEK